MKLSAACALGLIFAASSSVASAQPSQCAPFYGAILVTDDGEYLGRLSSKYDSDSVFNKYGTYGSKYSSKSIWNEYGEFGGEYSTKSPFNEYTSSPPLIVKNRSIIGRLSRNEYVQGAVNPTKLAVLCFDYDPSE